MLEDKQEIKFGGCDECLKHSDYTRVSLAFSCCFGIIYIVLGVRSPYLVFILITGVMRQEEQLLEACWSNEEQERKLLPRRDVSTSRRHQVTTWRSTITEVNHSSRRDVTTSRRHQRRDVSSKFCISSLNARGLGNLGY